MRRPSLVYGLVLPLVLAAQSLFASTVVSTEFREVVADAAVIVRGRVTDVRAIRTPEGDVQSVVTIAVVTVLKGTAGDFVTMRLPGGTLGRYRYVMVSAPKAAVGDEAVFFLKRARGNTLWPVGLSMGIYRVARQPVSGRPVVTPPVVGGVTANASGPVVRGDARRVPMPVQEFESLVRLVIAAEARASSGRTTGGVR